MLTNGTLRATSYTVDAGSISANLIGNGALTMNGSDTVFLTGTNSYSGGTIVNSGTLAITNGGTLGATNGGVSISGGTIDLGGQTRTNGAFTLVSGVLTNGTLRATSYTVDAGSISANLVGTGALTMNGSGTVTLSGVNTYSGGTLISSGTLAGDSTSLQGNITNNSFLQFNQMTNGSVSSVLSGTGALIMNGTATLTLSGLNSYSGGTILNSGSLAYTNRSALGTGDVSLADQTTLNYTGSGPTTLSNNVSVTSGVGTIANGSTSLLTLAGNLTNANTTLQFAGGSYNVTGTISGGFNGDNLFSSALTLSNASVTLSTAATYYGTTTLLGGSTLTAGTANALPVDTVLTIGGLGEASTITNSLNLNGHNVAIDSLFSGTGAYNQILNSGGYATLTLTNDSSFGGSINGSNLGVTFTNASVTLTGTNSYTGTTTVSGTGEVLSLGTNGALTGTTNIVLNGSTLLLGNTNQINTNATITLNGGTLDLSGGTSRASQTLGALTLTADSIIDFGDLTGTSSLTFSSISGLLSNTLSIYDWNGTTYWGGTSTTGGTNQTTSLFDLSGLSQSELDNINFYSGFDTGFLGTGIFSGGTKIIPVPEPSVILSAILLLGWLILSEGKRLVRPLKIFGKGLKNLSRRSVS